MIVLLVLDVIGLAAIVGRISPPHHRCRTLTGWTLTTKRPLLVVVPGRLARIIHEGFGRKADQGLSNRCDRLSDA